MTLLPNPFYQQDILTASQFTPEKIAWLFGFLPLMEKIHLNSIPCHLLEGKIMIPLFFEPSSRTRLSHQTAMLQLGGRVNQMEDPSTYSSFAKGANFKDEIITYALMGDLIVIRHPEIGSAQKAAEYSHIPVINAGDGAGEHPTQAILDLATIWQKFGRLDNLTVVLGGDLRYGRTVHSLVRLLSLYGHNRLICVCPEELVLPKEIVNEAKLRGIKLEHYPHLTAPMREADIWYWTRVQKERFEDPAFYEKLKDQFVITPKILDRFAREEMILMHPFPRVNEISFEVDQDSRAVYLYQQMRNGVLARMALIASILTGELSQEAIIDSIPEKYRALLK